MENLEKLKTKLKNIEEALKIELSALESAGLLRRWWKISPLIITAQELC